MPTIHVSVPESIYAELKRRAAETGIQVTDLVRMYIKTCLSNKHPMGGFGGGRLEEEVRELSRKFDDLRFEVKKEVINLRGKQKELEEMFTYVLERMEMLEELVAQLRRREYVPATDQLDA